MMEHVSGYIRKENGTIIQSQTVYAPLPDGSRAWLHIYRDDEVALHRRQSFMETYSKRFDELSNGEPVKEHAEFYKEFFELGYKTKNGQKIKAKKKPETYFDEHFSGTGVFIRMRKRTLKSHLNVTENAIVLRSCLMI